MTRLQCRGSHDLLIRLQRIGTVKIFVLAFRFLQNLETLCVGGSSMLRKVRCAAAAGMEKTRSSGKNIAHYSRTYTSNNTSVRCRRLRRSLLFNLSVFLCHQHRPFRFCVTRRAVCTRALIGRITCTRGLQRT